ncbi:citrinin biosynthesis oxidoreductase CtnB [Rhizodiscina lignyota]|uniref:Citrinin biosynthesis oxidoreductase CtnB n=1 Tax=Rhizodiscina lignyota TaxID=1504668 RepID=A0A9P4IG00_9PEZI|nr:citrinin biosynthesis oxidoreductase CtnB [Rhizodiscina lignyota]
MTTNGKKDDPTLHSPRILCLHGGGVTGEVFRLQARALIAKLSPTFRLVFSDGPFYCDPGPGIVPVYANFGPYRRWLRWLPTHAAIDAESAVDEIWFQLRTAMDDDDALGADGEWVGLLGFSQGAKLSACLLFDQQVREEAKKRGDEGALMDKPTTWKFGVLLAGRAPLVSLSEYSAGRNGLVNAGEISEGFDSAPEDEGEADAQGHTLRIPTVHVHGLLDPGLHLHRRLLNHYCDPKSVTLVEWDGNHRVPIKAVDVDKVVEATFDVARKTGVI